MESSFALLYSPAIIIPALAILMPVALVGLVLHFKHRRDESTMQTVRELARLGQPIPPALLAPPERTGRGSPLAVALTLVGCGVGLIVFFLNGLPRLQWLWGTGTIPLFIGLAQLIAWRVDQRGNPHDAVRTDDAGGR